MRRLVVILHRWAGLLMAGPLLLAGLTGALLAFDGPLNHLLAPAVYSASPAARPLSPGAVAARVEAATGSGAVDWAFVDSEGNGRVGIHGAGDSNLLVVDPETGAVRHRLNTEGLPTDAASFMPFVYRLHYSLAAGRAGYWIMGIAALIWTFDTLVAVFLTFPMRRSDPVRTEASSGWWRRWGAAWKIRRLQGAWKFWFDVHRAGALWLWLVLLVFAWSAVAFNLHAQIYRPVMGMFFDMGSEAIPDGANRVDVPRLDWIAAQAAAEARLSELATSRHFRVDRPVALFHYPESGRYQYLARTSLDIGLRNGDTWIDFDDQSGVLLHARLPSHQASGRTVSTWLLNLHEANLFGPAYRVFVSLLGLALTTLCATGLFIWWKKRTARLASGPRPSNSPRRY
jgi:uncharacterized iron-regulated membrane protein